MTDTNGQPEPADTRDDLRSQLEAAFKQHTAEPDPAPAAEPAPVEAAEPVAEPVAEPTDDARPRDANGRFLPKEAAKETAKEQTLANPEHPKADKQAEAAPETAPQQPATQRIAPPEHWNGGGKVKWDKLPRDVQQQIAGDYKQINERAQQMSGLTKVLEPRARELAATYGSVEAGLNQLFQLADYAAKDPVQFTAWFLRQRGIDPAQLVQAGGQAPTQGQPDPTQALQQRIMQLEQRLQSNEGLSLQSEVQAFMNDPAHPYFNDVRAEMTALLNGGRANSLQDAYDMAVWANPNVRAQILAQEQEKRDAERKAVAAKAQKAAAATVTGSPAYGISSADAPPGSIRESLLQAMAQHGGRI